MNLNCIQLSGKVANFGEIFKEAEGTKGTEEYKGAFCVKFINVQLDRKDKETGFYENRAIKVIANGYLAEKLHNFAPMEEVVLTGILTTDNDWPTDDGEVRKGDWIIRANNIVNWPAAMSNKTETETTSTETKTTKSSTKKPKIPSKKTAPKTNKKSA